MIVGLGHWRDSGPGRVRRTGCETVSSISTHSGHLPRLQAAGRARHPQFPGCVSCTHCGETGGRRLGARTACGREHPGGSSPPRRLDWGLPRAMGAAGEAGMVLKDPQLRHLERGPPAPELDPRADPRRDPTHTPPTIRATCPHKVCTGASLLA